MAQRWEKATQHQAGSSTLLRLGEGRMVKRLRGVADYVNTLSDETEKLTDAELRAKTDEFRARISENQKKYNEPTPKPLSRKSRPQPEKQARREKDPARDRGRRLVVDCCNRCRRRSSNLGRHRKRLGALSWITANVRLGSGPAEQRPQI